MRFATAISNGQPALWAADDRGYHCVNELAVRHLRADLAGLTDVGGLFESGLVGEVADLIAGAGEGRAIGELELLPPILRPRAIVCVGRNYVEHVREGGVELPPEPLLFAKYSNTLVPDGARVPYPSITTQLDYEGELALVIGKRARALTEAEAWDCIGGYTIINDISARDLQDSDMQWIRGKSLDAFAPMGPCIVTPDEIGDVDQLRIRTLVNGEVRQDCLTSEMHFKIPGLLAFITQGITLQPGDIVATGTPSGVGLGFSPPKYLKIGDRVEVSITAIGSLNCEIVDRQ